MDDERIATALRNVLNAHGHGFHYAVLRRCAELRRSRKSNWNFVVAEFPVELNGHTASIDLILAAGSMLMVVECKRADPALARWCFAKAPYTGDGYSYGPVISVLFHDTAAVRVQEWPATLSGYYDKAYHLGYELRTGLPGDGQGASQKAISAAFDQVMRGVGGLMRTLENDPSKLLEPNQQTPIVPAIFTTAELYVSDVNLSDAELATGRIDPFAVSSVPWLWYQTNLSRQLRPGLQVLSRQDEPGLVSRLTRLHTRGVAVVSVSGIESFLAQAGVYFIFDRL
jgi:hypothetical protein